MKDLAVVFCMLASLVFGLSVFCGCDPARNYVATTPPAAECPPVNIPENLRYRNWTNPYNRQGSCCHASTCTVLQWQGESELAEAWRKYHSGGETANSILRKYDSSNIEYAYTAEGDPNFLIWASETNRGAIIWWKPRHCCTFLGFCVDVEGKTWAAIADNNHPRDIEFYPALEFIRGWRALGGFAATPLVSPPATPPRWPTFMAKDQ